MTNDDPAVQITDGQHWRNLFSDAGTEQERELLDGARDVVSARAVAQGKTDPFAAPITVVVDELVAGGRKPGIDLGNAERARMIRQDPAPGFIRPARGGRDG